MSEYLPAARNALADFSQATGLDNESAVIENIVANFAIARELGLDAVALAQTAINPASPDDRVSLREPVNFTARHAVRKAQERNGRNPA